MANLNIDSEPNEFMAAFNPVVFEFSSLVTGTGNFSQGYIYPSAPVEGDTITFDGVTITCKDNPGFNEFLSTSSGTLNERRDSLINAINDNPNLNYKYRATPNTTVAGFVDISALRQGSIYNKSISTSTGNITVIGMIGGTDEYRAQELVNYGAYLNLIMQNGGGLMPNTFGSTATTSTNTAIISRLNQKFDGLNNSFSFDLSNVLNAYVDYTKPSITSLNVEQQSLGVNNYYIEYGEEYSVSGSSYVRKYPIGSSQLKWVGNSAIPFNESSNMSSYSTAPVSILTNQPANKLVYRDQEEYLNFFYTNSSSNEGVVAEVTFNFTDNTNVTRYGLGTTSLGDKYSYFRCGPGPLFISTIENSLNKTVSGYTVTMYNYTGPVYSTGTTTTTQLTDTFNYVLNEECQDYQTKFTFLNKLGGWDTVHFTGDNEQEIDVERDIYSTGRDNEYNTSVSVLKNLKVSSFNVTKSYSGFIDKEYADWLKELVTSLKVYVRVGNSLRDIIILSHEWGYNEKTKQYSLSLTWRYDFNNNNQYNGK